MPENMNSLQRIDIIRGLLDKLVEARGREKAGYIAVIDDFLNHIQQDILIMEEKLKDAEAVPDVVIDLDENNQNGGEIQE